MARADAAVFSPAISAMESAASSAFPASDSARSARTSAESAPPHLRGRYLSLIQLAWNLSSAIAPVVFAWLLDRGPAPLWWLMLATTAVGSLLVVRLGRVLPQAGRPVTNAVDPATT